MESGSIKSVGLRRKWSDFAITSKGLENISDFIKNIKKAVAYGLSEKGH